jgi:hypothetical protein
MEAVPFDIACGDMSMPRCLDTSGRKDTLDLVEELDTRLNGLFEMIDSYAKEHGCHENLDFQAKLVSLKSYTIETAFKVGMLNGVISVGSPKDQVDRFERGLLVSLSLKQAGERSRVTTATHGPPGRRARAALRLFSGELRVAQL